MSSKSLLSLCVLLTSACASEPAPHGDPSLGAEAAIPLDQARSIALSVRSGEIKAWELERERGGSGLRYSFDISSDGRAYEVGVDARDGIVLENGEERD